MERSAPPIEVDTAPLPPKTSHASRVAPLDHKGKVPWRSDWNVFVPSSPPVRRPASCARPTLATPTELAVGFGPRVTLAAPTDHFHP